MNKKYVWYVAYGSNMLKERFMVYINGGPFRGLRHPYEGCTDKSPPLMDKPFLIPYKFYFGNESKTWNGKGVAFIDVKKPGVTLGRAYLITEEQLLDIKNQEGPSESWYGNVVEIPTGVVGDIPHKLLTSQSRRSANTPANEYLDIIFEGICETYPQLACFQTIFENYYSRHNVNRI